MGGNTLLWGGRFSEFYRYKVRAFRKKKATKIRQFIDRLLTKIFDPFCRRVGGGFDEIQNSKFRIQNYFCPSNFILHSAFCILHLKGSLSTFQALPFPVVLSQIAWRTPLRRARANRSES